MARKMRELNRIINQCVLNTLMTIRLCGNDDSFDELSMIRCVAIRLDQVVDDMCSECEHLDKKLKDFDIDYYIEAYFDAVNMEDVNNDQKDV